MKDFTLAAYLKYLLIIKRKYSNIITFEDYISTDSKPDSFCILRHDVDRFPNRALEMAILENKLGIRSTYYFRTRSHVLKKNIIKLIKGLNHEIGYHYECLSDSNGNLQKSFRNFATNLEVLRQITEIKTISMHSAPLSKFDNRDMWKNELFHTDLKTKFNILGEIYIDIDYSDIFYITDAGRNWYNEKNNLRDKVKSDIDSNIDPSSTLIEFLEKDPPSKFIFALHPERWPSSRLGFYQSFLFDKFANLAKEILESINPRNKFYN